MTGPKISSRKLRDFNEDLCAEEEAAERVRQSRAMAIADLRTSAKQLKSDFLGQMESRLSAMMDDVMDSLHKSEYPERLLLMSDPAMMEDKRKNSVAGRLPDKIFRSRPSPLTELLEVPHFKTIHHIFIATLVLIMTHAVVSDLLESDTVDLGFERLMWAFGKPLTTLGILLAMEFVALFILYPSFYFWSTVRTQYKPETRKMIDYGAAATFAMAMGWFMYFPASIMLKNPLRPASGALVTMEQCRLLMKMYAFVRSNVPRALKYTRGLALASAAATTPGTVGNKTLTRKESERIPSVIKEDENENEQSLDFGLKKRINGTKNGEINSPTPQTTRRDLRKQDSWIFWDDEDTPCPSYSKYLYFYFAPTLVYRDVYPRTTKVHWNYVCWNFAQVFGCIIYANFAVGKFISIYFSKVGMPDHPMSVLQFCNALFSLMLPGILGLILGFFLLLHSWHNAFAEMLCFGDRMFYKDWWNCISFSGWYKTWNLIVHDWLYTYIFKDAWELGFGEKNKALPTTLVFLVSSIFHEYILAFSLNFFLPVLFVLFFGFGFALVFIKNVHGPLGNVFVWHSLMSGTGILLACYSIEFYSRINCPPVSESATWDFFIPRSLSCGAIQWSLK